MAIVSVDELFEERTGAWSVGDGRSYNRVFRVLTNNVYDGPNTAIQAVGINRGDQYLPQGSDFGAEFDQHAYAGTIEASAEEGDGLGWRVVVQYGPYSALWAGGGPAQNPLLQPIDVSWSMRSTEYSLYMDLNGKAIVNTAGDPFDPGLMEDDPRPVLSVIRNESIWNQQLQIQYRNAVNSDTFANYQPLMSRVTSISTKSLFHQDCGWYYQSTYEFEFIPPAGSYLGVNGYRRTVVSQGMRALSVVTGQPFTPQYKGIPISSPVLLTQSGTTINVGQAPYFCVFQTKVELPFAVFQFDQSALTGLRSGFSAGYGFPYFDTSTPGGLLTLFPTL